MTEKIKEIPYGISDFEAVRNDNYYFVDKTKYIPLIEKQKYIFFIRPRRFGKSFWLNTLESYYDVNKKEMFNRFFHGTYVGKNPTDLRNSLKILKFDFSLVDPNPIYLEEAFEVYCSNIIRNFLEKYSEDFDKNFIKHINSLKRVSAKLSELFNENKKYKTKIYILIDEYDNFTNTILSTSGKDAYQTLTHGEGFFRHFFAVLKGGTSQSGSGVDRLFITGVSPITIDDVTSGFNIAKNISLAETFNEMLGFTEDDVKEILRYYKSAGLLKDEDDKCLDIMRKWYDGYIFSKKSSKTLFNSDMIFYFVSEMLLSKDLPEKLIDNNVKIDYGKLRHLIVMSRKLNGNFASLKNILEKGTIESQVAESFPLEDLTLPDNFCSLLYYFGLLTFRGSHGTMAKLGIPNLTVKHLMYEYIRKAYKDVNIFKVDLTKFARLINDMGLNGKWEPFFKFLSEEVKNQTSIRDYLEGEKIIQGFLLAYLSITDMFIPHTEYETGKGYSDFFMEPFKEKYPDIKYGYLIELKYISRKTKLTKDIIDKAYGRAEVQLKKYEAGLNDLKERKNIVIVKLAIIYHGWEMIDIRQV